MTSHKDRLAHRAAPAHAARTNRRLSGRLEAAETQLLVCAREESEQEMVRQLAAAKVDLAEARFQLLQREVRWQGGFRCLAPRKMWRWRGPLYACQWQG